jgi:UrcA family protein
MKVTLTALALALIAVPAAAASVQHNATVQTGDLELASEAGQKTLALRIHRAAKTLCASEAVHQLPRNIRAERRCVKEATLRALASVRGTTMAATKQSAPVGN